MKKFLLTLLTVALAVCSIVFVGAACSDNTETGDDRIYTVTFDSDGGTPVENQQVAEGKKAKEPDITVKTGYAFAGWFVKTTEWNFLAYTVTENVTLKAKWIANTYKITFDSNGGTPISDMEVTYNEAYTLPTPEKEDYVFLGWQENETDFSQSEIWDRTGGAKLTAKWVIAKSTITFDSDGAGEVSPMTINYKEDYSLPVITKEDYKFICWTLNGVKFENGTVLTDDITLVAKWEKEKFRYVENDGEITITAYIDSATDVIIPAKINGKPVTAFTTETFKNNTWITSVSIPDSITNIGHSTFHGCSSLASITIPDSITNIGYSAFDGCSNLVSITIGKNVKSIGDSAFRDCNNLTKVNYLGTIDSWVEIEFDGIYFNTFRSYTSNPLYYAKNLYINNNLVTEINLTVAKEISDSSFRNCSSLKTVTIGDSVTNIGRFAFEDCSNLANITIGNGVKIINEGAFWGCNNLTKVNYMGTIDQWAEEISFILLSNPLYYAKNLYINNNLVTEINITTATKISDYAFYNCNSLTSVTIGNSVTNIGISAFYGCSNLISIAIGKNVKSIHNDAFNECNNIIKNENGIRYVDSWIVDAANKTLLTVNIKDGTRGISNNAFHNCGTLTNITIPESIKFINYYAFNGCSNLMKVNYLGTIDQWAEIYFGNTLANPLYYAKNLYINNELVTEVILTTATKISAYAFKSCSSLTSVTIGNSVTSIGEEAFYSCSGLTSVTLGNSVTSIGDSAFKNCTGLTSVTIGNSVISIGWNSFRDCSNLKTINYTGTKEQWDAIDKGGNWHYNAGNYTINYNYKEENA